MKTADVPEGVMLAPKSGPDLYPRHVFARMGEWFYVFDLALICPDLAPLFWNTDLGRVSP